MGLAPARSLRRAGGCSKRSAERRRPEHLSAEAYHKRLYVAPAWGFCPVLSEDFRYLAGSSK
jgi:hypothetical protein